MLDFNMDILWKRSKESYCWSVLICAGHTIVHFAKDLLTTDGVPLPFSSLFNDPDVFDDDDIVLDQDDV